MTKIKITKEIASFVVGHSVSAVIVTNIHQNTIPITTRQKVQLYIGAFVVGAMVAEKAHAYTDQKIDEIVTWWREDVKKTA